MAVPSVEWPVLRAAWRWLRRREANVVRSEGVSLASGQDYALKTEPCQTVSKNDIAMPTLTPEIINAAILGADSFTHHCL